MSDANTNADESGPRKTLFDQLSETYVQGFEQSVEAQTVLMDKWLNAVDETMLSEELMENGVEGYVRAYEVWMDAADAALARTTDALEGEDVDQTEFRDLWLNAANDAFAEIMSTQAFAAVTGQTIEESLELRQQFNELNEDLLSNLGVPTKSDIEEIGERLVEFERRQHKVERKLDRVLEFEDRQQEVEQKLDSVLEDHQHEVEQKLDRVLEFEDHQDEVEQKLDKVLEFEDRQDEVEQKLDRVLEALEEGE